jgi:hypothetical protein
MSRGLAGIEKFPRSWIACEGVFPAVVCVECWLITRFAGLSMRSTQGYV